MDGASDGLGIRSDAAPDLQAITGEQEETRSGSGLPLPVFMKPAGGDEWQPLVAPGHA